MKSVFKYACAGAILLCIALYLSLRVKPCSVYKPRNILHYEVKEDFRQRPASFFKADNDLFADKQEWKIFLEYLASYRAFHNKTLAELKESKGTSVRTLTWSCSQARCGGMGDQLFRIQFFLLLAMMSDRLFLVHWESRLNQSAKYLLPGEIDWSYYDEQKGICGLGGNCDVHLIRDSTSTFGFGWTKSEYIEFGKDLFSNTEHIAVTGQVLVFNMYLDNHSMVDFGPLIDQGMKKLGLTDIFSNSNHNNTIYAKYEPLWYNWMHRLGMHKIVEIPEVNSGHIQISQSWLYLSHYIFTYLFKFPQDLVDIAELYKQQLGIGEQDYLSLHMRTGFMGTEEQESFATRYINSGWKFFYHTREWHCFIQHAIQLRDEILGPDKYIYMSTDTHLVRHLVDTVYAGNNIVYGSFGFIHSANQKSCGKNREPSVEGYLATWLDFYLMGNAKFSVHSYSSYAVNSAFFKPIPHESHSWVMYNQQLGCLASHRQDKSVCIC